MMNIKTKTILSLIVLGIVDAVIPIPIIALILLYVIIEKPPWFTNLVQEIYKAR